MLASYVPTNVSEYWSVSVAKLLSKSSSGDIVLTSDVDAFVMSSDLVRPLHKPGYKAWVFQYFHSVSSSGDESTFPMCFIALRLDFKQPLNLLLGC